MNKKDAIRDKRFVYVVKSSATTADEIHLVLPGCHTWQAYSADSKVDLTSHALIADNKLYFVDPIRLASEALAELEDLGAIPTAIILTNGNHERDTKFYWNRFNIPVYADPAAINEFSFAIQPIPKNIGDIEVLRLPGAGLGEIALFLKESALLVVGDILINLDSFSFAPLPDKYATDARQMRESLHSLKAAEISTICFAHGLPVRTRAAEKLAALQASLES